MDNKPLPKPYKGMRRAYPWQDHPHETSLMIMELAAAPEATDWQSYKDAVLDKIQLRYRMKRHGTRLYFLNRTFQRLSTRLGFKLRRAISELISEGAITSLDYSNNVILFPSAEWSEFCVKAFHAETDIDLIGRVCEESLKK